MLREKMLAQKKWAVVGASQDRSKYGYKVYHRLKKLGYTVYPVNPGLEELEGDSCYPDLKAIPDKPDVINMVISPRHGRAVLQAAADLGIKMIWFQPGTWNEELGIFGQQLGLEMIQDCVIQATSKH